MNLDGVSALVTGGASGLGEATARRLSRAGARVVILDLQEERGMRVASDIGGVFAQADVRNADGVIQAVEQATRLGPLRALVNCAGVAGPRRTIGRDGTYGSAHPLDAFQRIVDINLVGAFNVVRLAASAMATTIPGPDGHRGAIVNTASVAAFDGQVGQASYSAAKGGIVAMTLPLARDLAAVGIRVNTIAPGMLDTPIFGEGKVAEAAKEILGQDVLFPHRLGRPEEYASLAMELICNEYMNGETLRIDGGARLRAKSISTSDPRLAEFQA